VSLALFPALVYLLCAATSILCMVLLMRGYAHSGTRLLLWSMLCFVGLAINNLLLFVDLVMLPNVDLRWPRHAAALAALSILIYGFIWEAD
jgi:hypothetical protein